MFIVDPHDYGDWMTAWGQHHWEPTPKDVIQQRISGPEGAAEQPN